MYIQPWSSHFCNFLDSFFISVQINQIQNISLVCYIALQRMSHSITTRKLIYCKKAQALCMLVPTFWVSYTKVLSGLLLVFFIDLLELSPIYTFTDEMTVQASDGWKGKVGTLTNKQLNQNIKEIFWVALQKKKKKKYYWNVLGLDGMKVSS